MAWTEPGKTKKPEPKNSNSSNQGPPDLEQMLKNFWYKLLGWFTTSARKPGDSKTSGPLAAVNVLLGLAVVGWGVAGIFVVPPAEQTVILQFGRYHATVGPGLHWFPHFIQTKSSADIQKITTYVYQAAILTKDQNIVMVSVDVQYRIANLRNYLFNVVAPERSVQYISASAVRHVIGQIDLNTLLNPDRSSIGEAIAQQINQLLSAANAGIVITNASLFTVAPPEPAVTAFDDAFNAQQDEQRYVAQAHAYVTKIMPATQRETLRLHTAAQAYQQRVVLNARLETIRYLALLPAYHQAPAVTRTRLYLSMMETLLSHTKKVLMATTNLQNTVYLPLDKWFSTDTAAQTAANHADSTTPATDANQTTVPDTNLAGGRPQRPLLRAEPDNYNSQGGAK